MDKLYMQNVYNESIEMLFSSAEQLLAQLNAVKNFEEKLKILDSLQEVNDYLATSSILLDVVCKLTIPQQVMVKALIGIKQGDVLFSCINSIENPLDKLQVFADQLLAIDLFYAPIGGIVGYYKAFLSLVLEKKVKISKENDSCEKFLHPEGFDLEKDTIEVRKAVYEGISSLSHFAEIYPVGGAGERLSLIEEESKKPLPASLLRFGGRTLLEGMIRDLQAKEYLYYLLTGKQIAIPLALMTSVEKDNDFYIRQLLEENKWFGRPVDSYLFFIQPLAPIITKEGFWSSISPLELNMKPGGHGVMWRLAIENGIFETFKKRGCKKLFIRQINNPVAGTDQAIFAFTGFGYKYEKTFGFASCKRALNTPEGIDVVIEKKKEDSSYTYCLTNVEYTDFTERGIEDIPCKSDSRYSIFPSNTNILFADIEEIEKAVKTSSFPGLIINLKSAAPYYDASGISQQSTGGRLESTMQNIADVLEYHSKYRLPKEKLNDLKTFVTFNKRTKTISVTKSMHVQGQSIIGTPEGALFDMAKNHHELLTQFCRLKLPPLYEESLFLEKGPSFVFWYHPALGPLYSVIAQKIQGGEIAEGSELNLEIAEVQLTNLTLAGSLKIEAKNLMGKRDSSGLIQYGVGVGRCVLKNVSIQNKGINREVANNFWKNQVERTEEVKIILLGESEFIAEGVNFTGSHFIEVADGQRVTATQDKEKVIYRSEPIGKRELLRYQFDKELNLQVTSWT